MKEDLHYFKEGPSLRKHCIQIYIKMDLPMIIINCKNEDSTQISMHPILQERQRLNAKAARGQVDLDTCFLNS